jgi:hypothetical protein
MGQLVFQANAGGQTALVGPNPSTSISINIPATNGNMVTTGDSGTVTSTMLASGVYTAPGTIGSGTPNTGAFTTLSASSTVSGTGFTNLFATPPAIGSGTASTGAFTTLSASSTVSGTGFSNYLASPPAIGGTTPSTGAFTTTSLKGSTSGSITLAAPAVAGTNTATLPAATGTVMVSGNMPAFSAYASAGVSLTQNVSVKIPIDTEEFDTASCFNNTGSTVGSIPAYAFLPNVAGYYQVGANIVAAGSAYLEPKIYKNGSVFKISGTSASTNAPYNVNVNSLVYLNGTTDYIEFYVSQGNATLTSGSGQSAVYFYASMVRAA